MTNSESKYDKVVKLIFFFLLPLSIFLFIKSTFNNSTDYLLPDSDTFSITFNNEKINENFISLFEEVKNKKNEPEKEIVFRDLKVELAGIVSMKNMPDKGYIILNFLDKDVEKKIFKPGDKINDNIFLETIHSSYIIISINSVLHKIYLTDQKKVTNADGILILDVSLIEILPYLKIKQGKIKSTLGIYISDRVDGKILKKLHLKETDLLFNLNGYNVFNLATLNDAYRKIQNKNQIVASIYRDGKIKKLVARRIDV